MCPLSNSNRSDSSGEEQWEAGDAESPSKDKLFYKALINKANSVPLIHVFKFYNVKISEHNKKVTCPFKSHKGGRERTPSFEYYPQTNSFYCHGCKVGTRACNFVAEMDGITRVKAAFKILDFSDYSVEDIEDFGINYSERLSILMDFSDFVRNFLQINLNQPDAIKFIEEITSVFDQLNSEFKLDNKALAHVVSKLKDKVKANVNFNIG